MCQAYTNKHEPKRLIACIGAQFIDLSQVLDQFILLVYFFFGFVSEVGVKVIQTWLLLFEIFSCNGSSTCLIFPAITLLCISQTFSSQEYLSGVNSLNKKSPKKKCKVHGH